MIRALTLLSFVILWACPCWAEDIFVNPGDSIQAAINGASNGDSIFVSAGTYNGNIDLLGKSVSLIGSSGAESTIINGTGSGPAVTLNSGETRSTLIEGFTIQNGQRGINISNSSPTIARNIITNNESGGAGGIGINGGNALILNNQILNNKGSAGYGVEVAFSNAHLIGNSIRFNTRTGGSGGIGGAGVAVRGAGNAVIRGNFIDSNVTSSDGGGISLFAAGNPLIENNIISNNIANDGGGIGHANFSDSTIRQNLIVGNTASGEGGGIEWLTASGGNGPLVVNNTVAFNSAQFGSAVFADGFDEDARLINNILFGIDGVSAVGIGDLNDQNDPMFMSNLIYSPNGDPIEGNLSQVIGVNGNFSEDPLFVDPLNGDYSLMLSSNAIDAGLNSFVDGIVKFDLDGNLRIVDGNGDLIAVVDLGAFEFQTIPEPGSIAVLFGLSAIVTCRRRRL